MRAAAVQGEVLTAGVTDDAHHLPYVVMERLYGATLRAGIEEKRAQKRPFEIIEIASTVTEIAMPLAHAHEMGIVHRDVKPENVFLAEQRDSAYIVKLLDFGIAALVDEDPAAKRSRVFSGSRQYASPEQLDGRATTPASDVYSLGLILYEMLTFTLPHDRHDMALGVAQTAFNALKMPLLPLNTLRDDVPPRLEALVENCLEYRPDARPTALQVASKLRDVKRALERNLLGNDEVNVTDVTGPPAAVLMQRLDNATGDDMPPGPQRFGANRPVNLLAATQPPGAPVTAKMPVDHEVFFMNPVVDGARERDKTDPMPQMFVAPDPPPPPAPDAIAPQRVVMLASPGVAETLPIAAPLVIPPPPPDATARLPLPSAPPPGGHDAGYGMTADATILDASDAEPETRTLTPNLTQPVPYQVVFLDDLHAAFAAPSYKAMFAGAAVTLVRISATRVGLLTPAVAPGAYDLSATLDGVVYERVALSVKTGQTPAQPVAYVNGQLQAAITSIQGYQTAWAGHADWLATFSAAVANVKTYQQTFAGLDASTQSVVATALAANDAAITPQQSFADWWSSAAIAEFFAISRDITCLLGAGVLPPPLDLAVAAAFAVKCVVDATVLVNTYALGVTTVFEYAQHLVGNQTAISDDPGGGIVPVVMNSDEPDNVPLQMPLQNFSKDDETSTNATMQQVVAVFSNLANMWAELNQHLTDKLGSAPDLSTVDPTVTETPADATSITVTNISSSQITLASYAGQWGRRRSRSCTRPARPTPPRLP